MKCVILVRHAKSSWDDIFQKDFDRPLNERGHKDAPKMAKRLFKKKIAIDAFITSPAERAFSTCRYFAEQYEAKEEKIIKIPQLYEPSVEVFYEVIGNSANDYNTIAIFSHNPGITAFVNELTEVRIEDMPTCALYGIKADIEHWKDFRNSNKTFWFFNYPRQKD